MGRGKGSRSSVGSSTDRSLRMVMKGVNVMNRCFMDTPILLRRGGGDAR